MKEVTMTRAPTRERAWAPLAEVDPEVWQAMCGEHARQRDKIELIASENYTYAAVMEAQGSWLTNKYAEGLPGRRYYGGCEYVDIAERLAQERALALFPGAAHVNVQPHSGAQANMAAYLSVLDHGDRIMGMNLAPGGHLTHGSPVNFSGRWFDVHTYGVGALLLVDIAHIAGLVAAGLHPSPFPHADLVTTTTHKTLRGPRGGLIFCRAEFAKAVDKTVFPGVQGGPLMHVIAAKALALKLAASEEFKTYQERTVENARGLARHLMELGARVISGGTDTHLLLIDVTPLGVTGRDAEGLLDRVGITVNKNAIPFDPHPPAIASGIRLGTPATTSRGFGVAEMREVAGLIVRTLQARDEPAEQFRIAGQVAALCARFPVPGLSEA